MGDTGMTKVLFFLPYTYKPYLDGCLQTLKIPEDILMIKDETPPNNIDLPASINLAFTELKKRDAEWFVLLNPQMNFGEKGGLDILESLEDTPGNFIYFSNKQHESFAWHCCAIHREVIDKVGKMDTNFFPTYFDDVDYDLRYKRVFGTDNRQTIPIDAHNIGYGQSNKLAGIKADIDKLIVYFATKWGIHPSSGLEGYNYPFNDPNKSLAFFPPAGGQTWDD